MSTMEKIECTNCDFVMYSLTNYRAISLLSIHQTRNPGHTCSITNVPWNEEKWAAASEIK